MRAHNNDVSSIHQQNPKSHNNKHISITLLLYQCLSNAHHQATEWPIWWRRDIKTNNNRTNTHTSWNAVILARCTIIHILEKMRKTKHRFCLLGNPLSSSQREEKKRNTVYNDNGFAYYIKHVYSVARVYSGWFSLPLFLCTGKRRTFLNVCPSFIGRFHICQQCLNDLQEH